MTTDADHPGMQPAAATRALDARLTGRVIVPGDRGYDVARQVWNARIDRHPAAVVRVETAADVAETVRFARDRGLPVAVRSGGHSPGGFGTVDGGVVIDVSAMKRLHLDLPDRQAWAEPGLTWGEYTARTQTHGLATPGGDVATVGLSGLTLAGGMGWLMRRHGMTIDNVLAVELVTAEGQPLTASAHEHPDLFWALRGGGGNTGVVTGTRYRLHAVRRVLGGAIVHAATHRELRAYAAATQEAPDDLTTISFLLQAPPLPFIPAEAHGRPVHLIVPVWVGDLDAGRRALRPFRSLGGQKPIADTTGPTSYGSLFGLTAMAAARRQHASRNAFAPELSVDLIDVLLAGLERITSPFGLIGIRELGGAMARVPADATAFAHRDKGFYLTIDNGWAVEEPSEAHVAWTEALWSALGPGVVGAYAGFLGDEPDRVHDAYPPATYARLAEVKRRFDPDNVFSRNANVRPAGG